MATVSVTVPCYQGEQYLPEAIRSVLAQTHAELELIVLDDGSSDRSGDIVKSFNDQRIHYFYQENRGLAATRNRLVELAQCDYIAFLDQDDYWEPSRLERQLALIERQPATALVYADCYVVDSAGRVQGRWSHRYRFHRGSVFDAMLRMNFIPLPTVLIRKAALQEAGPFPAYKFAEEYDVFLKCASRHDIDYVAQPLAYYRLHPGQSSNNYEVVLSEVMDIYSFWQRQGIANERLTEPRAMAFYGAGKAAIYRDGDTAKARRYLRQSLAHRPKLKTASFLALSLFGAKTVKRIRSTGAKLLGSFSFSEVATREISGS